MQFTLSKSLEILERTPMLLEVMLSGISEEWITGNEGENTWSPKQVVAHLIVCEKTDWIVRAKVILSESSQKTFIPIDMTAHFEMAESYSLIELLKEFKEQRTSNIKILNEFHVQETDLLKTAIHPRLGEVNLQQLIAAWTTHDLSHLTQITRVMAKQNRQNIGRFSEFMSVFK
jgi:hypothetical protein